MAEKIEKEQIGQEPQEEPAGEKKPEELPIIEIVEEKEQIDNEIRVNFDSAIENFDLLPQPNEAEISAQEELSQKRKEREETNEKRASLEQKISEKRNLLGQENKKNFLIKLFRASNREQIGKQIKTIEQEQSELKSSYDLSTSISSAEQTLERIKQERQIDALGSIERAVLNVRQKYENLKNTLTENEKLKTELDEQLVAKELMPKLKELKEKKIFSQKQADQYLNLVRDSLKEGYYDSWNFYDLPEEKRKEIEQRREQFNQFDQLSNYQLDDLKRGAERMSSAISNVFDLLIRNEAHKFLQKFAKNIEQRNLPEELATQIKQNIEQADVPKDPYDQVYDYWHQVEKNPERIPLDIKTIDEKIFSKYFLTNDALQVWDTVKENSHIQKLFSEKAFSDLEQKITEKSINELLETQEHTDKSVNLGYRLLKFKNIKAMPFIIMNCWRESGYSGEMPFLSIHANPQETRAYKLIASLSKKEIDILKTENIPGLMEVIESVRTNPQTFSRSVVDSPDWTKLKQAIDMDPKVATEYVKQQIDNPVYTKIQQNLAKMCLHMMQEKDERKQFFVMGLLKNLNVDLEEGYKLAENILKQSDNPKLQAELLEMVLGRYNDLNATLTVIRSYPELTPDLQEQVKQIAPELFSRFFNRDDIEDKDIKMLALVLGKESQEIQRALSFIGAIKDVYEHGYHHYRPENLESYIKIAKNPEMIAFIKELARFDYPFNIDHAETLSQIIQNKKEIIPTLQEIKENFPDFKYQIYYDYKYNPDTEETERIYTADPYESLLKQISVSALFNKLYEIQQKQGSFSQKFSNGLMRSYYLFEDREKIETDKYDNFYQGIQKLAQETVDEKGKLKEHQDFYCHHNLLNFLAKRPERVDEAMSWPETYPHFFTNLKAGGIFEKRKETIIREFLSSEDPAQKIASTEQICTKENMPYWKFLFFWTDEVNLKEQLKASVSKYPISQIAGKPLEKIVAEHKAIKAKEPSRTTRLERVVERPEVIEQMVKAEITAVPFTELAGGYKRLVFRDYLRRVIETSRSEKAKKATDARNRAFAAPELALVEGMYLHGSAIDYLDDVLSGGNRPREALGEEDMGVDSYGFHTDFSRITDKLLQENASTEDIIMNTISGKGRYGSSGAHGQAGQIFYIYRRDKTDWEPGKDYLAGTERGAPKQDHGLILGGIPGTETSAIILRNPEVALEQVKIAVLGNGFYVPVYDMKGKLLFTSGQYDAVFEDLNLTVPVEIWDIATKTTDQPLGSNPGGIFVRPGPTEYYVKFGEKGSKEEIQMWTELIADDIYRTCKIPVPETGIKKVEGSYGRASKWIKSKEGAAPNFNAGFLVDLLTQNYWDMKVDNVTVDEEKIEKGATEEQATTRIDNGAAFPEYRGTKIEYDLEKILDEAKKGKFPQTQGGEIYKNISQKELEQQARDIADNLTPEEVKKIVNKARLPRATRQKLEQDINNRVSLIKKEFKI